MGGGTEKLTNEVPPAAHGPYVLIFALDGVGHDQFEEAAASGLAPHLEELIGKGDKAGIHEHSFTISNALSVLPSTTYDAWASIFTGRPPAYTAIPGNEWYQGAIAYVYLADRSTCPNQGSKCDWRRPLRFDQDVMVVANAFEEADHGEIGLGLNNTLDLIFARRPAAVGQLARPYEILDRDELVSIPDYLKRHPRPDLIRLDERMRWLSEGPYGNRAGDVLLLSKSGLNRPIQDRYYFSAPYNSWHGSPTLHGNITFAISCAKRSGAELKRIVARVVANEITQLNVVPLVLELLKEPTSTRAEQSRPDVFDVARLNGNEKSNGAPPETLSGLKR